jgi:hypothetical protein
VRIRTRRIISGERGGRERIISDISGVFERIIDLEDLGYDP